MQIDFMIECNEKEAKIFASPVDSQFVDSNANL
jgi:hypothetical protein